MSGTGRALKDRSFETVRCVCGETFQRGEADVDSNPDSGVIGLACPNCGEAVA